MSSYRRTWYKVGAICGVVLFACSCAVRPQRSFQLPGVMLWAWQRPENLGYIDPTKVGVAYLAGTARITSSGFPVFEPRLQPLSIPPGTAVLPVVRIESSPFHKPVEENVLTEEVISVTHTAGIRGLQIDFDARASERPLYRSLLVTVRNQLRIPLGVTALVSWCDSDRWLDREPISEAVPMFFRMGREPRWAEVNSAVCNSSIGLSTDEPWPVHRKGGIRRVYVFSPRAWTRESYSQLLQRLKNWI